jgi:Transposase DDE domain/Insertion element 4 transposase N-terminal
MANRADILKQKFQNSVALPFEQVLPETVMQQVLCEQEVKYRQRLYTPMVVVWAWLSQVLDADKSLSNAVKRVIAWLAAAGEKLPSADTGGYSKARQRLPLAVLQSLLRRSADALMGEVKPEQQWCGRRVKAYDGTTVLMSDSRANQKVYPQHGNQKAGSGFPIAKLMVWFCVTTGAVVEVAISPLKTSEWQLARQLYATLKPTDVVVADSAYGTYVDLALVRLAGADAVFRKHYGRRCDFRRGKKLGIGDHIVGWQRPQSCPQSMSRADFDRLPSCMEVREVHLLIQQPGFRSQEIVLVTTLLDAQRYPKAKLAQLYRRRWQATEVNLKHLKTTLKMEMIAAKTPQMVQKDIWAHLLAYNLLRTLSWQSAQLAAVSPEKISLQGTRQQFNQFRPELAHSVPKTRRRLYTTLLKLIGEQLIPLRPHRAEPRVVKQRPKAFPRMQQPRRVLKAKLVA